MTVVHGCLKGVGRFGHQFEQYMRIRELLFARDLLIDVKYRFRLGEVRSQGGAIYLLYLI